MKKGTFSKIRQFVAKVPAGKVVTYGSVATAVGIKDARIVGFAMHGNKDPKVPCHRVVNRYGGLALNYAFGGDQEQRLRLKHESVTFIGEHQVDLSKHLWKNGRAKSRGH